MPTRLDEIEVALHRQGHRWRIGHRDDYETLLALVAVARAAEAFDQGEASWGAVRKALEPLLAENGEGSGL